MKHQYPYFLLNRVTGSNQTNCSVRPCALTLATETGRRPFVCVLILTIVVQLTNHNRLFPPEQPPPVGRDLTRGQAVRRKGFAS